MTSLVARQNSPSRLPYRRGATVRGGVSDLIDSTCRGRGETKEPIIPVGGLDEQSPQPMGMGGWSLGCQGHAVAKGSAQRGGGPRCRRPSLPPPPAPGRRDGEARCQVPAGRWVWPARSIRPAAHTGLERAPWGRARPAAEAARLPTAPRRGAAPLVKRWGKRPWERREDLGCLGTGAVNSCVLLPLGNNTQGGCEV